MKTSHISAVFVNEKGMVIMDGILPTLIPIDGGPKEEYRGTKKRPLLNQIGRFTTTSYNDHGVHNMGIHGTLELAKEHAERILHMNPEVTFVQIDEICSEGTLDHRCDVTRDQLVDVDGSDYMDLTEE